ncbi:MAG TPA: DEAD/DEAH box helicase family protein [Bacilli bacterium]|nr:DEAD/DEAH box helicase family protein [Bacilli bacterium]
METQYIDREEINKIFKRSNTIYRKMSIAHKEVKQINEQAKKELYNVKKEIAKAELDEEKEQIHWILTSETERNANVKEIINQTDIRLTPGSRQSQKAILKELYLEHNCGELMKKIKDTSLITRYQSARNKYPRTNILWNLAWKFYGERKKQDLLQSIERVKLLNNEFDQLEIDISLQFNPLLNMPENELWVDFEENKHNYYEKLKEVHGVSIARISKEDFEENEKKYEKLVEFKTQAEVVFQKSNESVSNIKRLISEVNKQQVDNELQDTSIDEFRKLYPDSSLRLHLLAQKGISTVSEMNQYRSFMMIDGIGHKTNNLLYEVLEHYKSEVEKSIGLKFDPANKTNNQTEILKKLYIKVNHKELDKEINKIKLQYYQLPFNFLLDNTFVRSEWAMQQLAKNEVLFEEHLNKQRKLNDFVNRYTSTVVEYSNKLEVAMKLKKESIWSNFNANAAEYYAILEREFGIGSANVEDTIKRSGLSEEIIERIKNTELNEDGLNATLRSWQDFGAKYLLIQKKVLIGDEMGLGKTLISIATMVHLTGKDNKNKFLVICPASIMANWERELNKFSKLNVYRAHGPKRDYILDEWQHTGGVAITTYSTASALNFDRIDEIDMITVDEAHYVKNPNARRTKEIRELTGKSKYALYLTGTPLENKVEEMTQIIKPLAPAIAQDVSNPRMRINANQYRKKIAPVYLRRTKNDVSLELPPLNQVEEWLEFGDEEFEEYKEAVVNGQFMKMRRAAWTGGSPAQSPKINRLLELANEAVENGNKIIVFSFFRDVIKTVEESLGNVVVGSIHGDVSIGQRQEIIDEFRDSKTKNVLVAQINTAAYGLNIQFANTIIFCEPQIKPSLESQAVARAYRMGQVDNVFVYRLLTVNSVDELMMDMLGNKQALFDQFADRSHLQEELKGIEETEDKEMKKTQSKIIDLESARLNIKRERQSGSEIDENKDFEEGESI